MSGPMFSAPVATQHLLIVEFHKFVNEIERKIGVGYSTGTVKNWKVTLGHLKEFLKATRGAADNPFKELDLAIASLLSEVS